MGLLELQFRRVFAGDHAFIMFDEAGHAVQKGRLAGAGAARNQRVDPAVADNLKHFRAFGRNRSEAHEIGNPELVFLEFTNGESGAVDRERRRDHVDAASVGQARVANRRGFIDTTADLADDSLTDVHELGIVAEADIRQLNLAADFDEHTARAVDHDVGDVVARQKRLERAIAQDVVADILQHRLLLGDRHDDVFDGNDFGDDVADFIAGAVLVELRQLREIDCFDQCVKDRGLDLVISV